MNQNLVTIFTAAANAPTKVYGSESSAKGRATSLQKKTGVNHRVVAVDGGWMVEVANIVTAKPKTVRSKAEIIDPQGTGRSRTTRWIPRVASYIKGRNPGATFTLLEGEVTRILAEGKTVYWTYKPERATALLKAL